MKDRVLTEREMCRIKFDENFKGDPQLYIDGNARTYIYQFAGPVVRQYDGYSDAALQRCHSRCWGMTREEMYGQLWVEWKERKGRYKNS